MLLFIIKFYWLLAFESLILKSILNSINSKRVPKKSPKAVKMGILDRSGSCSNFHNKCIKIYAIYNRNATLNAKKRMRLYFTALSQ
jgi:hypothetical protein